MDRNEVTMLADKARAGDRSAFEKLYDEFSMKVFYFIRQNVGADDAAEDITSETFTAAIENIHTLRKGESFVGWLYSIAYKKCADHIKNISRRESLEEEQLEGSKLNEPILLPDDYAVNRETKAQLKEIIDSLPADMRAAVIMYYYDEMTIPEVSAALETNDNNTRQKLFQARKKIKAKVEKLIGKDGLFAAVPMSTVLENLSDGVWIAAGTALAVGLTAGLNKASGGIGDVLLYITRKYWSKHKKSLAALLFSGVLLCAVVCCAFLMIRQDQKRWLEQYYDYHGFYTVAIPTPDKIDSTIDLLSTEDTVRGEMYVTGIAGIGSVKYQIGTIDDPHGLAHIPIEAGRMPETENEIAIDRGVLNKLGFFGSVGDDITLDEGTFKLVGIIGEDYGSGRPGSLLYEQRIHQGDTYYTDDMKPTKYMPLLFTGGDGSKNAEYTWVMLDNIKHFETKTIFADGDELNAYLKSQGIEADIQFFDKYNNKPAQARMWLIGYDNVNISSETRVLMIMTGISALIAVLSVIATLRNIFAERESAVRMLRRVGLSRRRLGVMYFMECLILTVIQTILGLSLGSLAHLIITKTEVRFLGKRDVTGFTIDPIIKEISIDPFAAAIIGSAAVLGIGYLFSAAMLYIKRRNRRRKKAGSLYMCISRIFRSKMVSVIQTLALTLICFGTLFGYLCYHNTTGFYSEDDDGNVKFYSNTDTKFGPAYQFDLEDDNITEYYNQTAASYELGIGNLIFMRNAEEYFGVDDKTADTLGDCILTTTLSQTFIPDDGEKGLKHDIPLGSEEEKQFFIDNSSSEGKALFESGKTLYRVKTKLSDKATIESLSSYVTSGSIDMDKLSSGEEILLVVKHGEAPYKVGESFTLGSATSANDFGIDKLTLKEVRVGAVIEIPKDMEQVLKYSVSVGDDYSLLTTATGAENIGLHDAKYNEIFAYEEIGSKLPLGTGMEVFSLSEQRRGMLIENASQFISMGLLVLLMSLLGFAAYFNGIGMKIRLKEYQISIMRAVGTPLKKLRRRLMLDSIKIPVYAAAIAYALTRAMQRVMEFANSNADKLLQMENKFANADNFEMYQSSLDKEMLIRMQFLTGKQMWYVSALLPTVTVFAVMCIITIMITRRSFKMFTPDIASSLSKGRKRQ